MMPIVIQAISKFQEPLKLIRISQSVVDYETVNVENEIEFLGSIQPFSPAQLVLKPTEERSWNWWMIHTLSSEQIFNGDKIEFDGKRFKVMKTNDYYRNGYYEYHCIEDFTLSI